MPGVRLAIATALFRHGELSLVRSARLAKVSLHDFIAHVARLGIPVVDLEAAEVERDLDTLEEWLASS